MSYKLCSLKEVLPGSVVRLPIEFRSPDVLDGVVLGLQYDSTREHVDVDFRKKEGKDWASITKTMKAEDKLCVLDDEKQKKQVVKDFASLKFDIPSLGMSMGCDPEVFVKHADGRVFPAWEFMPSEDEAKETAKSWMLEDFSQTSAYGSLSYKGERWQKIADNYVPRRCPAFWDGAQAEFSPWAKKCLETLHCGTREGLKAVLAFARAKDPAAKLSLQNVVELSPEVLKNTDAKYIQFRCSPSNNIYDDEGEGIQDARGYKYRCAGGHIHFGFTRAFTPPGIEQIVRGLDAVLGVIGVSLAAGIDNPERRRTYGRAGEFRLPKHGIEYRVLSNFWLSHPAIAMLVFDLGRVVVRFAESGLFNLSWVASDDETREVINNCDINGARKIIKRNAAVVNSLLNATYNELNVAVPKHYLKMRILAFKTILNGIQVAVKDPFDIEGNWKLDNPERWVNHCRGLDNSWRSAAIRESVI